MRRREGAYVEGQDLVSLRIPREEEETSDSNQLINKYLLSFDNIRLSNKRQRI